MTVSSTTNRKTFAGNGVTTSFATSPVVFFDTSDLVVTVVDDTTGAETALLENTDYTVSGGSGSTGTISLAGGTSPHGALLTDTTLVILRTLPLTQSADFVNNDINDAEVLERALDKAAMRDQQLSEENDRALRLAATETPTDALTVLPFDRASKYFAFDANKNPIATSGPTGNSSVPVSAYMETVLGSATAADARSALAAAASGNITSSGSTMATARLLGRTTASSGAIEELSVGASLTLTAGSLAATAASDTQAGVLEVAVQAEMEAGSSTSHAVTPGRQHLHPSAAKFWVKFNSAGTILASYNVTSITKNATGDWTVNLTDSFSSANWCATAWGGHISGVSTLIYIGIAQTASTVRLQAVRLDTNVVGEPTSPDAVYVVGFGDL